MSTSFKTKRLQKLNVTLLAQLNDVYHIDTRADNARADSLILTRIASLLTAARRMLGEARVQLCVAGDFLAPSCISKHFHGKQMVDVLKALKTNLVCLGNHEFDIPPEELVLRVRESNFQWLDTNFRFADDRLSSDAKLQPAALIPLAKDVHLVVFGLLYPGVFKGFGVAVDPIGETQAMIGNLEGSAKKAGSRMGGLLVYARRMASQLAKNGYPGFSGLAAYIALTHQDSAADRRLAETVPDLMMVLGGHEHEVRNRTDMFSCIVAKALSNARTVRLNWFITVEIAQLETVRGFGKDPSVLVELGHEIYQDVVVPATMRVLIANAERHQADFDRLRTALLSYFRAGDPDETPSLARRVERDVGGLIDAASGVNLCCRVVGRYFVFGYTLALDTRRPEFIELVPEDAAVRALIHRWLDASPESSQPILSSPVVFNLEDRLVRRQSTNFGSFVADIVSAKRNLRGAAREKTAVGLVNAGSFRLDCNIDVGEPISPKLLCDIFYHANKILRFTLSGAELAQVIRASANLVSGSEEGHGDFLQTSGLRIVTRADEVRRIDCLDAHGNASPLEPERQYTVATTGYVASLADAYSTFFPRSNATELEPEIKIAVRQELQALASLDEADRLRSLQDSAAGWVQER